MEKHTPRSIAHRGARGHAPENTLAAARLGHAEQAWMWELDTRYTRDAHLVVFHDETLERTTDVACRPEFADRKPWKVCDFTLDELRSLDAGTYFVQTDPYGTVRAGEVTPAMAAAYRGEKIPTLREALELVRDLDWKVNVEIKDHAGGIGDATIARDVCALIRHLEVADRVILSSFRHAYLIQAAEYLPEMPRAALVEKNRPQDAVAVCVAAHAAYYHPGHTLLLPGDVETLRAAGVRVNVWTVNEPEAMQRAIDLGVHGIITDFPGRLRALLEAAPSRRNGST